MAGNFQGTPREKTALDNPKLKLSAPTPGVQGKFANLVWGYYNHNAPRITIYTGDPNDAGERNNNGKIQANMDVRTFASLMRLLHKAVAHDYEKLGAWQDKVDNSNYIFPGGQRSKEPALISVTHVGCSAEGIRWISVTAENRPKIRFEFGTNHPFHVFRHGDGTPYTKPEFSALDCDGYVRLIEDIMLHLIRTKPSFPEPRPDQGGGGGGYGNRGGGGGGYGNRGGGGGGAPAAGGGGGGGVGESDLPW